MLILGIDPGLSGAMALVESGRRLLMLEDLPVAANGSGKVSRQIDAPALAELVRNACCLASGAYLMAVLEKPAAMPGQGVASMFSLGDSFGTLRGVIAAKGVPLEFASPAKWKKDMGLTSDKDAGRSWASRLFPDAALSRKKDHNRAEAIALACWGYRRFA